MAPAYDYTFSVPPSAPGYMSRHSMTINNKNSDIERADLLELAKCYRVIPAPSVLVDMHELVLQGVADTATRQNREYCQYCLGYYPWQGSP